jgi:hypothetical protein
VCRALDLLPNLTDLSLNSQSNSSKVALVDGNFDDDGQEKTTINNSRSSGNGESNSNSESMNMNISGNLSLNRSNDDKSCPYNSKWASSVLRE